MDDDIITSSIVSFRKITKGKKPLIQRKREKKSSSSSSANDDKGDLGADEPTSSLVDLKRSRNKHRIIHTTSKQKRQILEKNDDSFSSDDEEQERQKALAAIDKEYSSSGAVLEEALKARENATRMRHVDTDFDQDAQSQFERVQRTLKEDEAKQAKKLEYRKELKSRYGYANDDPGESSGPKIYRGMAMYGAKIKEDTIKGNASAGLNRQGPIRSTQFMRASIRWDYHPEICKDWKETGFCTFGDNCKFMHDRTDYKHGWEIDRDYEEQLKESKVDEYLISSSESSDDEELPFKCFICREDFKNPVVTKCKHYFCESCALNQFRKSKKCYICNAKTDGQFAIAKNIIAKMNETKKESIKQEASDESGEEQEIPETKMEFLEDEEDVKDVKKEVKKEVGDEQEKSENSGSD